MSSISVFLSTSDEIVHILQTLNTLGIEMLFLLIVLITPIATESVIAKMVSVLFFAS